MQPKRLQQIGNSSPSLVTAAARAKGRTAQMVGNEDPRAPYKVYEGEELRGSYETRAEARRRQQQLESEQANRLEPHRHVRIEDNSGDAAV
jgi:predicted alpha/beta superfamily hydrolase